ncbi:MAG: hypothetical protein ACTSU2_06595 [Promethearchaeota archaeon]
MVMKILENIRLDFENFIKENPGFEELLIMDENGDVLFDYRNFNLDENCRKELLLAWNEHKGNIKINKEPDLSINFTILRSDPLQFAALKPGSPYQMVGTSINGKYAISLLINSKSSLNSSSVIFQKFIYKYL